MRNFGNNFTEYINRLTTADKWRETRTRNGLVKEGKKGRDFKIEVGKIREGILRRSVTGAVDRGDYIEKMHPEARKAIKVTLDFFGLRGISFKLLKGYAETLKFLNKPRLSEELKEQIKGNIAAVEDFLIFLSEIDADKSDKYVDLMYFRNMSKSPEIFNKIKSYLIKKYSDHSSVTEYGKGYLEVIRAIARKFGIKIN